jgi:hypothetical protein
LQKKNLKQNNEMTTKQNKSRHSTPDEALSFSQARYTYPMEPQSTASAGARSTKPWESNNMLQYRTGQDRTGQPFHYVLSLPFSFFHPRADDNHVMIMAIMKATTTMQMHIHLVYQHHCEQEEAA